MMLTMRLTLSFVSLFLLCVGHVVAQSTSAGDCVDTINAIALRESLVLDTSFPRLYTLCPGTDFEIGYLDFNHRVKDGQPMLPLKSNMKIQCGADGSRLNGCHVRGGDVQVDGTDRYGLAPREIYDVVLQGITFYNSSKYMVELNMPGEVQFQDCEFRVRCFYFVLF